MSNENNDDTEYTADNATTERTVNNERTANNDNTVDAATTADNVNNDSTVHNDNNAGTVNNAGSEHTVDNATTDNTEHNVNSDDSANDGLKAVMVGEAYHGVISRITRVFNKRVDRLMVATEEHVEHSDGKNQHGNADSPDNAATADDNKSTAATVDTAPVVSEAQTVTDDGSTGNTDKPENAVSDGDTTGNDNNGDDDNSVGDSNNANDDKGMDKDEPNTDVDNNSNNNTGDKSTESYGAFLKSFFTKAHIIIIAVILCIAVAVPFAYMYWIRPATEKTQLTGVDNTLSIVTYDHTWDKTTLSGELADQKINTTQYILHYDDSDRVCYAFHAEDKNPVNTLKISMVIGEEKSRNLIQAQASAFAYGMREGKIAVEVCPLINDDEYSVLASEALGEVDYNDPSNTWSALVKLTMVDTSELTTTDERVESILNTLSTISGVSKKVTIQKESILNGSFMQNARQMSNENTAEAIPALWMNGENITNGSAFRLYDYQSFYEYLNTLPDK